MGCKILIAGSGTIGRDLGLFFLKKGNAVSWVSRSEPFLVDCQGHINGAVHAFMAQSRGSVRQLSASFFLYEELEGEAFDAIIECTSEILDDKLDVACRLVNHINDRTIFATTSLSIRPPDIHPACMSLRVRYPLEITTSAELIIPQTLDASQKEIGRTFCRESGISCLG
jgi:3-hydroxyacyl-CoA dehydrogenase